jgi:hypothetical protein
MHLKLHKDDLQDVAVYQVVSVYQVALQDDAGVSVAIDHGGVLVKHADR